VAAASGPTVPTGTVVFTIDGTAEPAVTLSNGFATYTTTSLNAGYHTIVAAYSGNVMFASSTSTISLTVGQATPTISWPALTPVSYGTALSATQLDATSPVAGTFAYTPSVGTVLNAGLQTLSVTFAPTDTTDYTSATATVTLTVNKVTPTITWPIPATIAYGTALSATQLDATSATAGTFTYTPAAGTLLKAGAQTLSVTFTPTDATDYASATATVTLTVNQEILYVTAYGQSKIYGAALPTLTYAFAGFVKGDTAATATTGVPSLTTTATVSSSVGTYPITVTAGTLTATNYSLKLKPGTLTVTQAPLYVTANAANKVYGAALPTLTYTYAGFLNGDTAATATTGVPSLSTTATVSSPVGTYPITVAAGTLTATNYSLKLKPGTLTVTPASLYVTAYNQSMMRGAPLPTLTYAFAGFVNGDKASTATSGVPSLSTTATSSSPAGTYPITVAVGTLTAANYNLVLKPGTLTITAP